MHLESIRPSNSGSNSFCWPFAKPTRRVKVMKAMSGMYMSGALKSSRGGAYVPCSGRAIRAHDLCKKGKRSSLIFWTT